MVKNMTNMTTIFTVSGIALDVSGMTVPMFRRLNG